MSETVSNPAGTEETGSLSELDAAAMIEGLLPSIDGEQEEVEAQTESDEETVSDPEQSDEDETDAEEEATDEESQEPQAQTVKVKVDGEEIEVTLDELKSGYSRTSDYTKKTQEIAQARKALDSEYQAVLSERQQYGQLLNQLAQQLQSPQAEPDWDTLRATDPIEYTVQLADWQRNQQKQQIIAQEQQRLAQLQAIEQQKMMAQTLERERGALLAAIPEWAKPETAKAEKQMVIEQGKKLGFSEEELSQAYDHRAILALRKAALYDQLMSKRAEVKPVAATQKTVSPGTKSVPVKTDAVKRATANARRTGDVRDAAAAINFLI